MAAPPASKPNQPNNVTPGQNGQGGANGFIDRTFEVIVETSSEAQFMGMSNKTPPNANAAASQGTRTETITTITTYDVDVTGPNGQLKDYELPDNYELQEEGDKLPGCANCEITDITETGSDSTTEITDLPGANR